MNVLHINSLFYTIQGEGKHAGRRALFVRMPFCDLSCSWCDTEFDSFSAWAENQFLVFATSGKCRFAVITGGEPTMHKHTPRIIALLKDCGYEIAIESNGHFPIPAGIDWVTISPKKFTSKPGQPQYHIHIDAFMAAHEFKYVVDDEFDFSILSRHDITDGRRYSLSPEFTRMPDNVRRIIDFQRENPGWLLSLQTHKWIGIP